MDKLKGGYIRKYQTESKLKAVKSFLDGAGGAKLLARQWSVPEEKIRTWVSHYRLQGIDGLRPKRGHYRFGAGLARRDQLLRQSASDCRIEAAI